MPPFDWSSLVPVLGGLNPHGGGGFLEGWQRAQQEIAQRKEREQAQRIREEQLGMQRSAESRAVEDQGFQRQQHLLSGVNSFRQLLEDPTIDDPALFDQRLQFARQMAPQVGVDPGFLDTLKPPPDTFTKRKLTKLLDDFEKRPMTERQQAEQAIYWEVGGQKYTPAQARQALGRGGMDARTGQPFAFTAPAKEAAQADPFTLSPGQVRYDAQGNVVARGPAPREPQGPQGSPQWVRDAQGKVVYRIPRAGDQPYDEVKERQQAGAGVDGGPSPYATERGRRTVQSVDELLGRVNRWTTGFGSVLARIPETDARNFSAELDTLKANIAFNELTQMREASKTGGALGQVSNIELGLLQSALGALDAGQSPENLRAQLQKIKDSVSRWYDAQERVGAAPAAGGRSRGAGPGPSSGPRVGERRMIGGRLGEWDGRGWKAVSQ